ncbi:GNAT family N-acetyltransferase [Actinomycetaceae bacterium MB13-C1-2]|nr:GNAT family N-acetyltransferase [Actinomycetaceae bacterium MB13-C1-2]
MSFVRFRPLVASEVSLIETASLGTLNWCGPRFTLDDLRSDPELAHYAKLIPERGDFGIVAEQDDMPVGVVWALCLPRTDPGYGFVDEDTPELALWVHPNNRRQGLGRTLLRELANEAASRRYNQISLSVEEDNHSKKLYSSEGFKEVPGKEADGVMLLKL